MPRRIKRSKGFRRPRGSPPVVVREAGAGSGSRDEATFNTLRLARRSHFHYSQARATKPLSILSGSRDEATFNTLRLAR
jgi:hypothetical protein